MLFDPNNPESFLVWKSGEVLYCEKYVKQDSSESGFSSIDQNFKRQNTSDSEVSALDRQDTVEYYLECEKNEM